MIIAALLMLAQAPEAALDCDDPVTQTAMNVCSKRDFDKADAELNAVWKDVRSWATSADSELETEGEQPGYAESLLASQRAWLTYRDAHCRLSSYDARGGTLQPLLINTCLTNLTEDRIAQLRELLVNQVSGEPKTSPEI